MSTDHLFTEAIGRFGDWLAQAKDAGIAEPTAMTLATVGLRGGVSARTVLLKQVDEDGFVFYTNKRSRKGRQLARNARVALCFLWAPLKHQVLVEGEARPVPDEQADRYWRTRPRESQLGAWASHQSERLESTKALEARYREVESRHAGREVPRPAHWSGYRVIPDLIEFWSGKQARLHERIRYTHTDDTWFKEWLNP